MTAPHVNLMLSNTPDVEEEQKVYLDMVKRAYNSMFGSDDAPGVTGLPAQSDLISHQIQTPFNDLSAMGQHQGYTDLSAMGQHIGPDQLGPAKSGMDKLGEVSGMDDDELLGAARAHGIDDPESIPREQLRLIVQNMRNEDTAPQLETGPLNYAGKLVGLAGTSAASAIVGGVTKVADTINRLSGYRLESAKERVGDYNVTALRRSRQFWNDLHEKIRMSIDPSARDEADVVSSAGHLVGMFLPTAGLMKGIGVALGKIVPYYSSASEIARVGIEGGLTTFLMEGGDRDKPWLPNSGDVKNAVQDPGIESASQLVFGNVTGTSLFGAATAMALHALFGKLRTSPATATPGEPVEQPIIGYFHGANSGDIPYADYEVLNDAPLSSPYRGPQKLLGAPQGEPPVTPPSTSVSEANTPPQQQGTRVTHYGTYSGGPANPNASISADAGTLGRGLYVSTLDDPRGLAPGYVMGADQPGAAVRSFTLSPQARLFDLEAPLDPQVVQHVMSQIAPEYAAELGQAIQSGEVKTNADLYFYGAHPGDMPGQSDSANELLGMAGYHGVKYGNEINLFHPDAGNFLQPAGTPSPVRAATAPAPQTPQPFGGRFANLWDNLPEARNNNTPPEPKVYQDAVEMVDWYRQGRTNGQNNPWKKDVQQWAGQMQVALANQALYGTPINSKLFEPKFEMTADGPKPVEPKAPARGPMDMSLDEFNNSFQQHPAYNQLMDLVNERQSILARAGANFAQDSQKSPVNYGNNIDSVYNLWQLKRGDLERYLVYDENGNSSVSPTQQQSYDNLSEQIQRMQEDFPWLSELDELEIKFASTVRGMGEGWNENQLFRLTDRAFQLSRNPVQDLVDQIGTVWRNPDGSPMAFAHGTDAVIEEINPYTNTTGLYHGDNGGAPARPSAFYLSNRPSIVGGDPLTIKANTIDQHLGVGAAQHPNSIVTPPGMEPYAFARFNERAGEIQQLQMSIERLKNSMAGVKADQSLTLGRRQQLLENLRGDIEETEDKLFSLQSQTGAPNVHGYYLTSKKVFNVDRPLTDDDVVEVLQTAISHPDMQEWSVDLKRLLSDVQQDGWDNVVKQQSNNSYLGWNSTTPIGQRLYDLLGYLQDDKSQGSGFMPRTPSKNQINGVLRAAGYDTIAYDGGRIGGQRGLHQAVAVLDTKVIVPRFAKDKIIHDLADMHGIQLTKQQMVMASEELPNIAGATEVTDSHVASASLTWRPGSTTVVQSIGDVGKVAQDLLEGKINSSGIEPKSWAFAERNGRVDLIMSPLEEITPEQVAAYERTGYFHGMRVLYKGREYEVGRVGSVGKIKGDGIVLIDPESSKTVIKQGVRRKATVNTRADHPELQPLNHAPQYVQAPDLWEEFKQFAQADLDQLSAESGIAGRINLLDETGRGEMPRLFDEFTASKGLDDPGAILALRNYFDMQIPSEYRAMDPEGAAINSEVAADIEAADATSDEPQVDLPQLASWKGFRAIPDTEGGMAWVLADQYSPTQYAFPTQEEAQKFLANFVRDLPDFEPFGHVPSSTAEGWAKTDMPDDDRDFDQRMAENTAEAANMLNDFQQNLGGGGSDGGNGGGNGGGGGGGGTGGTGPSTGSTGGSPTPPTGGTGVSAPPTPPTVPPTGGGGGSGGLSDLADRGAQILHQLNDFTHNWVVSRRFTFIDMEQLLADAGHPELKPYRDWSLIKQGMDAAHIEQHDHLVKLAETLNQFGRYKVRRGNVWKVLALRNPGARPSVAKSMGFNDREINAIGELDGILRDMHGPNYGVYWTQLRRFVNEVQTRQLAGDPNPFPDAFAYPDIGWYVQKVNDTKQDLRYPDAHKILEDYIRSHYFFKNVGASWQAATDTWNKVAAVTVGGRQPLAPLAQLVHGWLRTVRYGYEPGWDVSVDAVQKMFQKVARVELTKGEAAHVLNGGLNMVYRAFMGFRPHVILRDAIQPLLGRSIYGSDNIAKAYALALKGGSEYQSLVQDMVDYGIAVKGMPPLKSGVINANELASTVGAHQPFTPEQIAVRERWARVGDILHDILPRQLRTVEGGLIDPLWLYTKQNSFSRIQAGIASALKFRQAFASFNASRSAALAAGAPHLAPSLNSMGDLLNLDAFSKPERDMVMRALLSGDTKGAEKQYVNVVVARVMHSHGVAENPQAWTGMTSRIAMQFSSYTSQEVGGLRNLGRFGSTRAKVGMALTAGGVLGGLYALSKQTGWNFSRWNPWNPFAFASGPIAQAFISLKGAAKIASNALAGQTPTDQQLREAGDDARKAFNFNPLSGLIQDYNAGVNAVNSPNPVDAFGAYFFTGETRGDGMQWRNFQNSNHSDPTMFQQFIQSKSAGAQF